MVKPYECTYPAGENLEERKSEGQKGGWNRKKESIDSSMRRKETAGYVPLYKRNTEAV